MIPADAKVIGFTGPFGSGSTTAATILNERKKYTHVRLSRYIRERWKQEHPDTNATRSDLQRLGNRIRKETHNPGYLAKQALDTIEAAPENHSRLIFDGIRNLGEIEVLSNRFGKNFYLFTFECQPSERWERVRAREYEPVSLTETHFNRDNNTDKDQENIYGQQVQLCVDRADVLINNDVDVTQANLRQKLVDYLELVTGEKPRYANPSEIFMNLAYSSSHASKCLKRQVGAVLVAAPPGEMGNVVGLGFNENPIGTSPCVEEAKYGANPRTGTPGKCYRDLVRYDSFVQLATRRARCPSPECGHEIQMPTTDTPPWNCPECGENLENYFWQERALTLCTAVHAEVQALFSAQGRAAGTTLYTTTLPCFQCSEKLIHAAVKYIVFTEPYPDVRAGQRLEIGQVQLARFEGVRSARFDEIFSRARPYISQLRALPPAQM